MTALLTLTHEVGFSQCAPVNMDALDPLEAVRDMCKADRCGRYGKSWSCPPARRWPGLALPRRPGWNW